MQADMLERKALPIGKTQFMEWSDRIIKGSLIDATSDSLRFSLAAMILHLAPTEAFKEDAYFILSLRKAAVNQTAHSLMTELKEEQEKKRAEETASNSGVTNVLENKEVQGSQHGME